MHLFSHLSRPSSSAHLYLHAICLHFPDAFCLFSSQLHFLSCFHACHFIHCPSSLPICLCLFMLSLVLCLPYYSCWSLHSCLCSLHTYPSRHASWSHLFMLFIPVILVALFFMCALLFLSSSYAIQLAHSVHALVHLINLIPAHHFITVFAALSCLHTPHVHCLFMLVISSVPSYLSGNSYFLSLYAH